MAGNDDGVFQGGPPLGSGLDTGLSNAFLAQKIAMYEEPVARVRKPAVDKTNQSRAHRPCLLRWVSFSRPPVPGEGNENDGRWLTWAY